MSAVRDEVTYRLLQPRFTLCAAAIIVFALALRLLYVWMATTDYPIRGDTNQYVLYAWNLTHRGVFSTALPDDESAPADDYRGPGYPAFLAAAMIVSGHSDLPLRPGHEGRYALGYATDTWMRIALGLQVILGTATVLLVIVLGRYWLSSGWVLAAGLMTALWPHLVTFSGTLLSETLFGFLLVLAVLLLCSVQTRGGWKRASAAGLIWGVTYLVNPIVALFPLVAAVSVWRDGKRNLAIIFLASFFFAPAMWAIRNAFSVRDSRALQRIEENFVQGSWPEFLLAYNHRLHNDIARQIVEAVNSELQQLEVSPATGLGEIGERIAQDPTYYLTWYLAKKPYLLWDWSIWIGIGDIYFVPVQHSPFEVIPILSGMKALFRWLNPVVFALAATCALAVFLWGLIRWKSGNFALSMTALLTLYLTAVHVALQAEPRYSIPYRPEEILLAFTTVAWLFKRLRGSQSRSEPAAAVADS